MIFDEKKEQSTFSLIASIISNEKQIAASVKVHQRVCFRAPQLRPLRGVEGSSELPRMAEWHRAGSGSRMRAGTSAWGLEFSNELSLGTQPQLVASCKTPFSTILSFA
jgi:hypothetical protein